MYDFRVIQLIWSAHFWTFLLGSSVLIEDEICDLHSPQSILVYDAKTIKTFPEVFSACLSGIAEQVICFKLFDEDEESTINRFARDGRQKDRHVDLRNWVPGTLPYTHIKSSEDLLIAIERNRIFLNGRRGKKVLGDLIVKDEDLRATLKQLKIDVQNQHLSSYKAYRLNGKDGRGNVQFTAYFTPVINAKRRADAEYRFAIYKKPTLKLEGDRYPTREEIDGKGVLLGKNLELAYVKNPFDAFAMQVQGSGFVLFEDGTRQLLAFDSKNGHPYVSIGRLLVEDGHIPAPAVSLKAIAQWFDKNPEKMEYYLYQNPSYIFFKSKAGEPKGASGVPLVALHSVAVDPDVIPYGSILLARVPILDDQNQLSSHEWRLLFAHDTGSAIKGTGHIDLYMGAGEKAKRKSSALHHYGEVWLLLKK